MHTVDTVFATDTGHEVVVVVNGETFTVNSFESRHEHDVTDNYGYRIERDHPMYPVVWREARFFIFNTFGMTIREFIHGPIA